MSRGQRCVGFLVSIGSFVLKEDLHILETYGDGSRMKCRYLGQEFYAKHGLGHVLQTDVRDEAAFKRGDLFF